MFRAVLWKEWREQAAVVVALLVLGGGVLAAVVQLGGEPYRAETALFALLGTRAGIAFVMLAVTAGVTIGGTLFAGETEAGTVAFLHGLPPTRNRHWWAKIASGLLLTVGAGVVLIAEGLTAGVVSNETVIPGAAAFAGFLVLAAFGWGAVGSVLARTTLAACGIGLLCAVTAIFFAIVFGATFKEILRSMMGGPDHESTNVAFLVSLVLWVFGPLPLSWLLYVAPDWSRDTPAPLTEPTKRKGRRSVRPALGGRSGLGLFALLWLSFRQWLVPVSILGATSLALGLSMLAEPVPMLAAWPVVTLFAGALVGTIGWADEQGRGSYRFWGERRLPATRLWLAKVSAGLALTLGLGLLFLLPSVVRAIANSKEATAAATPFPLLLIGGRSLWNIAFFTFLWPVYGFVAGHLAGLLFRKTIVAFAVAVLAGGAVAGLWFPSVYAGGLHVWQFAATPLAVVITARLLMRSWATDRLAEPRAVTVLVVGLVVAFLTTTAGLAWRVLEVPVIPEGEDDLKFAKSIPTPDQNQAGAEVRAGLTKLQAIPGEVKARETTAWLFPNVEPATNGIGVQKLFSLQIHEVATRGYPADRPDLDAWMDDMFAGGWDEPILAAAGKPLGVVENVNDMIFPGWSPLTYELRTAAYLMIARGLQKQARGDPAAYTKYLDATLAASRNMRNKSVYNCVLFGLVAEQAALSSVSTWLERLGDRPDLLREVREVLARHEATNPVAVGENWLAEQTLHRNSVNNPTRWAAKYLDYYEPPSHRLSRSSARNDAEMEMIGFAWAVPWERERLNRIIGLRNVDLNAGAEYSRGGPVFLDPSLDGGRRLPMVAGQLAEREALRRAATLLVNLRLFQAETGKPASDLGQLVPKYLAAVPADPFDGKPFRYRLSAGEWIEMETIEPTYQATVFGPGAKDPSFPPLPIWDGVDPNRNLTQREFDAVAAVGSGLIRYPKPLPGPPGLEEYRGAVDALPGEGWTYPEYAFDAVAAAAGGIVQWPLQPFVEPGDVVGGVVPGGTFRYSVEGSVEIPGVGLITRMYRRRQRVESGQGVLWSIGPDGVDDGGKMTDERHSPGGRAGGDRIWIVPPPTNPN